MVREETAGYGGAVVLYRAPDGTVSLDVRIEKETLWLNQRQIADLFATERSVITKHLRNIFASGELERDSACANFAHTAPDGKTYQVDFFNLDAVISIGYRVNSKRGTQFRIWATQVLRDHILKDYTINERRLKELRQSLRLVGQVLNRYDVSSDQAKALLRVVTDYENALDILDDYDHQRVRTEKLTRARAAGIEYDEALAVIDQMRTKFGGTSLFGREKDDSLRSSLGAVMQTLGGKDVYPCYRGEGRASVVFPGEEPQLCGW